MASVVATSLTMNGKTNVALIDWDRTLRPGWTLMPWMNYLTSRNIIEPSFRNDLEDQVEMFSARHINHDELAQVANAIYARAMKGHRTVEVAALSSDFVVQDLPNLFPFVRKLMALLTNYGLLVSVVSGAPAHLLREYGTEGVAEWFGMEMASRAGIYSGTVQSNSGLSAEKARIARTKVVSGQRIILGMGDSDSDMPLLREAKIRVVVNNPDLARRLGPQSIEVDSIGHNESWLSQLDQLLSVRVGTDT